jgi:hypothetical protein
MYLEESSSTSGYWIWIKSLGWIFSASGKFPEAYHLNSEGWVLFDLAEKSRIKFWKYSDRSWSYLDREGFDVFSWTSLVPEELQNIEIRSSNNNSQFVQIIGKFFWYESQGGPLNVSSNVYLYNSDGYFYPYINLVPWDRDLTKNIFFDPYRYKLEISEGNLVITEENTLWEEEDKQRIYPIVKQRPIQLQPVAGGDAAR